MEIKKKKTKIIWRGLILRLVILITLGLLSFGGFLLYKIYALEKKIVIQAEEKEQPRISTFGQTAKEIFTGQKTNLRGQERNRINILLLGMGGEGHSGKYLTDTIILASIDPETFQTALLSIPRDLYVNVPETNVYTKINAVYAFGITQQQRPSSQSVFTLKKLIKKITGQEVDYYLALDFEGFKNIIDRLGGVDVQVEKDIFDARYPGPNFSYQTFKLDAGFHHLDGETALKYARVRHVEGGDFSRAKRQQEILAVAKRKAFSLETFANPTVLAGILETLGNHVQTDIAFSDLPAFIDLAKNINVYQTTNKVLDAWSNDSLLASSHVSLGGVSAYTLQPKAKNYSQIQELASNIFNLENLKNKKNKILNEEAKVSIITEKPNSKIKNALSRLGIIVTEVTSQNYQEKCAGQTQIINQSKAPKIFTLDFLAVTLDSKVLDQPMEKMTSDILLCLSRQDSFYFENQQEKKEEADETLKEQSILDNQGNVLFNKKD